MGSCIERGNEDSEATDHMEMLLLLQSQIKQNNRSYLIACLAASCSQGHSK